MSRQCRPAVSNSARDSFAVRGMMTFCRKQIFKKLPLSKCHDWPIIAVPPFFLKLIALCRPFSCSLVIRLCDIASLIWRLPSILNCLSANYSINSSRFARGLSQSRFLRSPAGRHMTPLACFVEISSHGPPVTKPASVVMRRWKPDTPVSHDTHTHTLILNAIPSPHGPAPSTGHVLVYFCHPRPFLIVGNLDTKISRSPEMPHGSEGRKLSRAFLWGVLPVLARGGLPHFIQNACQAH